MFHRTPAYEDGSLCPGDELVTVNGVTLRGLSRKQAADIIQGEKVSESVKVLCVNLWANQFAFQGQITLTFNRLEPPKGKTVDICKFHSKFVLRI